MRARSQRLITWVNGFVAGAWTLPARAEMEFKYDEEWIASQQGRPLSLSMPFNIDNLPIKGRAVEYYFDNLLPDNEAIRKRIKEKFGTQTAGTFDLLAAIGRDCVGAIQLLPSGTIPDIRKIEALPLTDEEVESRLLGAISPRSFMYDVDQELRISIAGAQEKTAFLRHNNQWCVPLGATPTTHIFKMPLGKIGNTQIDMTTSVENEWLCSRILAAYDIPTAESKIETFGATKALIVERFDRRLDPSKEYWLRLVQEDFCQATGTPSTKKYEEKGGPGVEKIVEILRGSIDRDKDLRNFMKAQILFWMIAGIDGHAKNFSIFLLPGGDYRLTPLYDILSAWPVTGNGPNLYQREKLKLAMSIRGKNKHYRIREIQRRHFNEVVSKSGLGINAEPLIEEILGITGKVIANVQRQIPANFPSQVLDSVLAGLEQSAKQLESMSPN